jgi:hypothetical protein
MSGNAILKMSSATGKWSGRSTALLLLLFWGAFFVEHLTEWFLRADGRYPPAWVWWQQFFHFVMLVGLGMMLRWDKPGAVVMVVATAAFFAGIGFHTFPSIALVNLVPIGCFGVYWLAAWRLRTMRTDEQIFSRPQKMVFAALGTAFTVFVLLCANELLGNPPLMTPALLPSSALAASWQGSAEAWPGPTEIKILITVNSDGTVSGRIGSATLMGARIKGNRTWLGRLMHWRSDYIIQGKLSGSAGKPPLKSGDRFSAPISLEGSDLVGSIFTAGKDTSGNRITPGPVVSRLRLKKV